MLSRLPRNAPVWLDRLSGWLEPFEVCFTHVAQRGAFRRYLLGLLSDSRRKSMSAMLERVRDPGTYQAFQHFITDAPWSADAVWRHLRATVPDRTGVLILDGTSFPKQGPHSVGVARQYCGALGKIANGQTAVTVALWTGARAWMLGATLYLPEPWLTPSQRTRARIPAGVRGRPTWPLALTLLRHVRASGITVNRGAWRCGVWRECDAAADLAPRAAAVRLGRLVHAHGVRRYTGRRGAVAGRRSRSSAIASHPGARCVRHRGPHLGRGPARARRVVSWRNGTQPAWRARCWATRVTPAHDWRDRRLAPEVWLLCERARGTSDRTKYYLVHLPSSASLRAWVRLTHQRWAIEQQ